MFRIFAAFFLLCFSLAAHAQTIVCFGDSLTAGHGAPPGSAYPDFLRKDLAQAGYHATVINQGINGDSTSEGLARLHAVLAAHPALVILELGANDALYERPVPEIVRNLGVIIEALQRAHVKVVLAGIDLRPSLGPNLPPKLATGYMQQFYALYPPLAERYRLPLIPFLLQGVYGTVGLMSPDYIHPNSAGYEKVAQTVLPYVEALLGKRPDTSQENSGPENKQ